MELSPHPNDIKVRLVDMRVPWEVTTMMTIVKDDFLTEVVITDVRKDIDCLPLSQVDVGSFFMSAPVRRTAQ